MSTPLPFDALDAALTAAVTQHLANALVQVTVDGPHWAAMYECGRPDASPFGEVATAPAHTVSLCLTGVGDVAEGQQIVLTTQRWPAGQVCRITTAVEPDESNWATFDVVPV